ncbi:ribosome biogenesis GTP-binding protein YihA/YsxC [Candidatus Latescibacterota bacterium]
MKHSFEFFRPFHSFKELPNEGWPEICISGRSNVGKSSLLNRISNRKKLALTSQKPGKTRGLNYFSVDEKWYMVDLPGYGYAKVSKSERKLFANIVEPYLEKRVPLKGIIQLIDARHGPISGDIQMIEWIRNCDIEVLYVFTKDDKLSLRDRSKLKKQINEEFGLENCILFSSHTGKGVKEVWSWIDKILSLSK